MSIPTSTKQWVLANKPTSDVVLDGPNATWKLKAVELPQLQDGQILIQNIYMSNDPAQRTWIWGGVEGGRMYTKPVEEGEIMRMTRAVCKVLDSKSDTIKTGTLVSASPGWAHHAVVNADAVMQLQELPNLNILHYLGAFGGTGLTAYRGLLEIGRITKDDVVLVSGAAGGTGSMCVQIAKGVIGAKKVIGIAGTDEKCRWVESLGADVCVNYKSPTFEEDLARATPERVNLYFDNVAGPVLDLALARMARQGRIVACGGISDYNSKGGEYGIKNWFDIVANRLEVRGFIVSDLPPQELGALVKKLVGAAMEGKIKLDDSHLTVVDSTFEDVPKTFTLLFEGHNQGKLITHIV